MTTRKKLMKYYVYLLKSMKDNNYYIGQTQNISKRFTMHNSGKVRSTKSRIPFILVGFEEHETRNASRWREYELKHDIDKKKEFIKRLT